MPTQRELDAFYRSGAYWHATGNTALQIAHENVQARRRVTRCLAHLPQAALRVLDVGAGHGCIADWLARALPGRIASYHFVEPDPRHAEDIGRKRPGFAVHAHATLPSGGEYDLVFLNHVLEHVACPREFMDSVVALLSPRGIAYVETPHLDFRFKDDVFPHTYFFTPAAFEALGNALAVSTIACESFGAWPGHDGGISRAAHRWLSRLFAAAVKVRSTPLQIAIDEAIWRYGRTGSGIWVRWLFGRRGTA